MVGGVGHFDPRAVIVDNEKLGAVMEGEGGLGFLQRAAAGDGFADDDHGGFLQEVLVDRKQEACGEKNAEGAQQDWRCQT